MSTSAIHSPQNFKDLYTDLLNKTREAVDHQQTNDQAKRYINEGILEMQLGYQEKLPWLIREAELLTQPNYSTGTITVTKGSTAVVGSTTPDDDTAWTTTNDFSVANVRRGGMITVSGGTRPYRIASVTDANNLVLNSKYLGDTEAGASYTYYEDQYALASDFLRPVDFSFFDDSREIRLISRSEFRRRFPQNRVSGRPDTATIIDEGSQDSDASNLAPKRLLRFSHPPDDSYLIPYGYVTKNVGYSAGATGYFTFTGNPSNGDTITINGDTWTFKTTKTPNDPDDETLIKSTMLATMDQLVSDLNATGIDAFEVCTYSREGDRVLVDFDMRGTSGDAIDISESSTSITASGSTLLYNQEVEWLSSDWDIPLCPAHLRSAIVDLALYRWYLHKKDDGRAQIAKGDADIKLMRVIEGREIGGERARIQPRTGHYKRSAKRPWSGSSGGRYDINGEFDRMER